MLVITQYLVETRLSTINYIAKSLGRAGSTDGCICEHLNSPDVDCGIWKMHFYGGLWLTSYGNNNRITLYIISIRQVTALVSIPTKISPSQGRAMLFWRSTNVVTPTWTGCKFRRSQNNVRVQISIFVWHDLHHETILLGVHPSWWDEHLFDADLQDRLVKFLNLACKSVGTASNPVGRLCPILYSFIV